jgi:integrase
MAKNIGKLDATELKKHGLTLDTLPSGKHGDGNGLELHISGAGARGWVYRYTLNGKTREMGLGSAHTLSLKDARLKRDELKLMRAKDSNFDPLAEKQKQKAIVRVEAAKALTFKAAAERWMVAEGPAWSAVHIGQVRQSLETYAYPTLATRAVVDIGRADVIKVVEPIWREIPIAAMRVRQRIWSVFEHAFACDERLIMRNPAELKPIKAALGKQNHARTNYASLAYSELPAFLRDLRERSSISARAFELMVLTALRTNEVLMGEWTEIDFKAKTWLIPARRMKARVAHLAPLSEPALAILRDRHARREEGSPFVFPGMSANRPLSGQALLRTLREMGRGGQITPHGFRATFRTWAGEETLHQREVIEMSLAHTVGNEVERSYNRGKLLEKRFALMNDWAAFCTGVAANNVVRLKARA